MRGQAHKPPGEFWDQAPPPRANIRCKPSRLNTVGKSVLPQGIKESFSHTIIPRSSSREVRIRVPFFLQPILGRGTLQPKTSNGQSWHQLLGGLASTAESHLPGNRRLTFGATMSSWTERGKPKISHGLLLTDPLAKKRINLFGGILVENPTLMSTKNLKSKDPNPVAVKGQEVDSPWASQQETGCPSSSVTSL